MNCPHEAHMETQLNQEVNLSMIEMVLQELRRSQKWGKGIGLGRQGREAGPRSARMEGELDG